MFLSDRDARERKENITGHDPLVHGETTFGEVFDASLGQVFDEELSISSSLNNEGYFQRREMLREAVDGGFDVTPYQDQTGAIDYDRIAQETDLSFPSDRELYDQRNELLAKRRAYSQDVIDRGNGMAQFLGSMTGYMLDPINVATLPIGASASALRGLSTMARVGRVAATEAVVGGVSELAIQPFVFAHKNEIGSPYEVEDALLAIGTAAAGGAAIGGAASGVAGLFRRVAKMDLPDTPEVAGSRDILNRTAADIETNPERMVDSGKIGLSARKFFQMDTDELSQQVVLLRREMETGPLDADRAIALEAAEAVMESRRGRWSTTIEAERLRAIEDETKTLQFEEETRLPRGERKALNKRLQELRTLQNAVEEAEPEIKKVKGVSARKAKSDAQRVAKQEAEAKRAEYQVEIDEIESRLETSKQGEQARANLSRVQQGVFPKRLQEALDKIEHKRMVEVDVAYLRKLEETRALQNQPQAKVENFAPEPEVAQIRSGKAVDEDSFVDVDMERYRALQTDDPALAEAIEEAQGLMNELDELESGLESVRMCRLG